MGKSQFKCERKFIVIRPNIIDFSNRYLLTTINILQTFLVNKGGDCHVRIEICNDKAKYFYCRKVCDRQNRLRLIAEDREISQAEYNELITNNAHPTAASIHKIRLRFEYKEQIFNLDILQKEVRNPKYCPDMADNEDYTEREFLLAKDEAIVMIELPFPEEHLEFPRHLFCVKEITNELQYTTKSLAKQIKKQEKEAF